MPKNLFHDSIRFFQTQVGTNTKSIRHWKNKFWAFHIVKSWLFWRPSLNCPHTCRFPGPLPEQVLKPTLVNGSRFQHTQSAQASIERNTVPCIPAGPKSCLVRKMEWSWYSAWSGSRRCWVLDQRHTCSRLREGLPRSIKLIDCKDRSIRTQLWSHCSLRYRIKQANINWECTRKVAVHLNWK